MFPAIRDYLGLPSNATAVPFNLVNATVAYAVSDIVWCVGGLARLSVGCEARLCAKRVSPYLPAPSLQG
jgi:hypothetical protein